MKKTAILILVTALIVIVLVACGSQSTGSPETVPTTTTTVTTELTSEALEETSEDVTSSEAAEVVPAETTALASANTVTSTSPKSSAKESAGPAANAVPVAATQRTTTTTRSMSTTRTTTTSSTTTTTRTSRQTYTEADYAEIVAAVRAYAESNDKVEFIWDTTLTYEYARSGRAGYHDVVNLNQNGKDGVVKTLKYNCDLTEWLVSGGNGGIPSDVVHYNVVKVDYQNEPYFALIYG